IPLPAPAKPAPPLFAELRRAYAHSCDVFEPLAQPRAATVRVTLRGPDRHSGSLRDLLERIAQRVLEQHDLRLLRGDARQRIAQLAAQLGDAGSLGGVV